jgi:DNA-binding GntR family transcriptional regulator
MPVSARRLEKTSLAEQAYAQLRHLILDQMIRPGEPIGIDSLAAKLGVSHTPVREALARLEGDRLVLRSSSGRYRAAPAMTLQDYADLFQARLLLEPSAAALVAAHRTEDLLATLEQSLLGLGLAGRGIRSRDFVRFMDCDALFHQTIARGCGNMFIARALIQLQAHHPIGSLYKDRGVTDAEAVIAEHRTILTAIQARDGAGAEVAMRRHIERARDAILSWISAEPAADRSQPPAQCT